MDLFSLIQAEEDCVEHKLTEDITSFEGSKIEGLNSLSDMSFSSPTVQGSRRDLMRDVARPASLSLSFQDL